MSVIGPRPQLVRDMVFMTPEQRRRHTAKPGLSGLAQVNGRNAISWEDKIEWDLKYIEKGYIYDETKVTTFSEKLIYLKEHYRNMMYLLRNIVYSRSRNWQHSIRNLPGILSGGQLRIRLLLIRFLKNTSRRL